MSSHQGIRAGKLGGAVIEFEYDVLGDVPKPNRPFAFTQKFE